MERKEKQMQGTAEKTKLDVLQARIFMTKTSAEALTIIQEISELIETSKFCLIYNGSKQWCQEWCRTFENIPTGMCILFFIIIFNTWIETSKE
jgi:hypothetical protein